MRINVNTITQRQKLIIEKGLLDYQYIMNNWRKNDPDFQVVYYDFYLKARFAVMNNVNRGVYFQELQNITPNTKLGDIIDYLEKQMTSGNYEFSIATKMLHTYDPSTPIYDSKVREYLYKEEGVDLWYQINHSKKTPERKKIDHDWIEINNWYQTFFASSDYPIWINWFDKNFPNYKNISNIKKIDFIIFAAN